MGLFDWWDDGWRDLFNDEEEDVSVPMEPTCSTDPWSDSDADTDCNLTSGDDDGMVINPATGLPMVGGIGGIDIEGNLYGCSSDTGWSTTASPFDED